MSNPKQRIREIEQSLEELPKGTLTYKTINGKSSLMCSAPLKENPSATM